METLALENEKAGAAEVAARGDAGVDERLRALEAREQALLTRERQARCREALRGRELPEALAECLDLSDEQRTEQTLELLASAINDAVARRVKARLGAEPPRAGAGAPDPMTAVRKAMGLE